MLCIGLTGGIGSGKSTVAELFAQEGVDIIDTDLIARSVVEPGTEALATIIAHFGSEILNADQTLNRQNLAKKIFNQLDEKAWLEKLLHPLIIKEVMTAKAKAQSPYCIIVIPLLIETLPNPTIDRILVVDSPLSLQISRTQARDQRSESDIMAIIATQATREERLNAANEVIVNDRGLTELREAVHHLHQYYLKLCESSEPGTQTQA